MKNLDGKIYLPSADSGLDTTKYLQRYIQREFPEAKDDTGKVVYSVPNIFRKRGEKQASLAEQEVFTRLKNVGSAPDHSLTQGFWMIFFHSACYAGYSFRNERVGRLMIREHDFVVFAKSNGKNHMALIEVKSTHDQGTNIDHLEKTSDAKVIKNNKRSAQHQLRDHLEILQGLLCDGDFQEEDVQSYIMWPFLSAYTKSPRQEVIKRWKEDRKLHVFEDTMSSQANFDQWFRENVLQGKELKEDSFTVLLSRFIVLSCGVFVDEVTSGIMALLTQQQLQILNNDLYCQPKTKALVVHGVAGTGKTLLVLRKLQQLHQWGQLNDRNRALYICYWPGIRCDMELKLEILGIREYVDTVRYFITLEDFLRENKKTYKHIFMDEAEAICLSFDKKIVNNTITSIYQRYHGGNCDFENCNIVSADSYEDIIRKLQEHDNGNWGELWFMVDINQALMFLPKFSPQLLKTPEIILNKVMRSTGYVFSMFKQFYDVPMPLLSKEILAAMKIPNITIGHHIKGPPIFWTNSEDSIDKTVAKVVIDLCATKGFKPNEICVIPFLVNEKLVPDNINRYFDQSFVGFKPKAINDVENYLTNREINNFLIPWALRVKGLEFKVVVMVIDGDDFDCQDAEDRRKAYIIVSRCTTMLILISNKSVRTDIESINQFQDYPFCIQLKLSDV